MRIPEALLATEVGVIRQVCLVPERRTVTEWADAERFLPETSTAEGRYRSSVVPYARRWQDLSADPSVPLIVLCWATQTTKSTVIENAMGYRIQHMPSPMVTVQPKIDAAESWAKERFVPMVRATPALRKRVRLGRSTESTLRYKGFPGGFVFVASAQSATELASRSAPFITLDEIDRYEDLPGEGNPVEIALKRQGAADVAQALLTSTPRSAETSLIWPYLEGGTYEYYELPCPHCGHRQNLIWEGLRWEGDQYDSAVYRCRGCEKAIDERDKPEMLAQGAWVATRPANPYPSSHLNGLYSPFQGSSWPKLARDFVRSKGKPADLQVFVNTVLAEVWEDKGEQMPGSDLAARLEPLEIALVPDGVGVMTSFTDVQDNRLETSVWGWGAGGESWLVLHEITPGDTGQSPDTPGSVWQQLDAVLFRKYPHINGAEVPIAVKFVDSGFQTSAVYRYCKFRQAKKVYPTKGVSANEGTPLLGKPSMQTRDRIVLYPIGVDKAKDEFLRSQIYETRHGPGYVHLPDWVSSDFLDQLVSEKRVARVTKGRVVREWRKKKAGAANEALDCRIGARAALEMLGARVYANLGKMAEKLSVPVAPGTMNSDPEPDPTPQTKIPTTPHRPSRGFIGGWK